MHSSFLDRYRESASPSEGEALSVSALNKEARQLLENGLGSVWVEGEISSLSQPRSGHAYFTLKDDNAQVRCALFRQRARAVRAPLREGQQVRVRAQVSLFEPRGDYQLIVEAIQEAGMGALLAALEELKQKLAAEGIFANARELPYPPRKLAIVTSPTGAALQDIYSVLNARWPWLEVVLVPVQVQGDKAAAQIAAAIALANRAEAVDALLVTRGGGSFEDLWCFNDERVARAIHASRLPVVSAVGHETDTTLADYAADVRAPTPSAAAERLVPDQRDLRRQLAQLARRLLNAQRTGLDRYHQRVDYLGARLRSPLERVSQHRTQLNSLEQRLMRAQRRYLDDAHQRVQQSSARLYRQSPTRVMGNWRQQLMLLENRLSRLGPRMVNERRERLQAGQQRLHNAMARQLEQRQLRLAGLVQRLDSASPLAILKRGYAVLERDDHSIVRAASSVSAGDRVKARLGDGALQLEVLKRLDD